MKKLLIFFIVLACFFLTNQIAESGSEHNVSGWSWTENIGWISFNNTTGGGAISYGVNVNLQNGKFSGHAWSENLGWISFNESETGVPPSDDPCSDTSCIAKATPSGQLGKGNVNIYGWARALNYDDSWNGWIRFDHGQTGQAYIDKNGDFHGWAWGSEVIGWISFNSSDPGAGGANYKVILDLIGSNQPPLASNPNETQNLCAWHTMPQAAPGLSITLNWTYSDPDEDPQSAYEIWLDDSPVFSGPKFNVLVEPGVSQSYALNLADDNDSDWLSQLAWGTTYYWKVKVKDSQGNWSEWSPTDSFTTPWHASPYINFGWIPERPTLEELVQFTDKSEVDGGATKSSWSWTFQHGDPASSNLPNPQTKFISTGSKSITLKVTDSDGYNCTDSKNVQITLPLPEWREIPPY